MHTTTYAVRPPPDLARASAHRPSRTRRRGPGRGLAVVAVLAVAGLTACSGEDPTRADLPADVVAARPDISLEEATFVLEADRLGARVTGATVADDLETGTTTCWAIDDGDVQLRDLAVDDSDQPLGNTGDALRTKQLMAAGVRAFCPDHDDQISQLALP